MYKEMVGTEERYQIELPSREVPDILTRSHPSGLTFSKGDIGNFASNFEMKIFTAVGNDGTVYLMQKTDRYNADDLLDSFNKIFTKLGEAKSPEEYADIINDFLKGAERYGARFNAGTESPF